MSLPFKILVGTHHKTGTVWLSSIFQSISKRYLLIFFQGVQDDLPPEFDVFFQDHSYFSLDLITKPFRGIHMIRDPRDIIVSGCFYHQKSQEDWLHKPLDQLNGLTYHEKLNSYKNIDDKLFFEMENATQEIINDLLQWNYSLPSFFEVKYETLILDRDLNVFGQIFDFLGFPLDQIPTLQEIALNNSLFSGKLVRSSHINSGQPNQWRSILNHKHRTKFLELYPNVLTSLGYEKNDDWIYSY